MGTRRTERSTACTRCPVLGARPIRARIPFTARPVRACRSRTRRAGAGRAPASLELRCAGREGSRPGARAASSAGSRPGTFRRTPYSTPVATPILPEAVPISPAVDRPGNAAAARPHPIRRIDRGRPARHPQAASPSRWASRLHEDLRACVSARRRALSCAMVAVSAVTVPTRHASPTRTRRTRIVGRPAVPLPTGRREVSEQDREGVEAARARQGRATRSKARRLRPVRRSRRVRARTRRSSGMSGRDGTRPARAPRPDRGRCARSRPGRSIRLERGS